MRFCSLREFVLLTVFLAAFCFAGEPNLPEVKAPWMKGERLTFSLGWGPITAATATLEVKPLPGGKTEFLSSAQGNSTITRIYPVYDTVYTRVRNKGLMTEVFRKNLH